MSVGITRLRYSPLGVGVPQGGGDSAGFVALKDGDQLAVNHGPIRGTRYLETVPASPVLDVDVAGATLTESDAGKVVTFNDTDTVNVNLPKASQCRGCQFHFFQKVADGTGTGHTVTPFAGDYIGAGITALTIVADELLLACIDGDAVGDRFTLVSNGVNGYTVVAQRGGDLEKVAP